MSEQQELFSKFDKASRIYKSKKHLLYSDVISLDVYPKEIPTCKPSHVIEKVINQLKAFHKADTTNSKFDKRQKECRNSEVAAVNMIQMGEQVHQPTYTNKFETQFELDTQMINSIENVEADHNGLTQEFDSTFCNTHVDASKKSTNSSQTSNPKSPIIITKSPKTETKLTCLEKYKESIDIVDDKNDLKSENVGSNKQRSQFLYEGNINANETNFDILNDDVELPYSFEKNKHKIDIIEDQNELESENVRSNKQQSKFLDEGNVNANECLINFDILNDDEELPCSYIFEPIKKSNTPSPLVFDLQTFQSFEKTVQHIVSDHNDILGNHLINSQIIGKELILSCDDGYFISNDGQLSPVLKIDPNRLHIVKKRKENHNLNNYLECGQGSKNCSFLNDEILFSSDEESEKEIPDLPMTCALKTSFYEQNEVLDKTMYVGFQTASDKAIKVCTNSFENAKSFLVEYEEDAAATTLTELVNICDKKCRKFPESYGVSEIEVESHDIEEAHSSKNETEHFVPIWLEVSTKPLSKNIEKVNENEEVNKVQSLSTMLRLEKKVNHAPLPQSSKIIQKSDQAPVTKNLSQQIDDCVMNEFERDMTLCVEKKDIEIEKFVGFKFANDKNIPISKAAFDKVKNIFEDIEVLDDDVNVNCSEKKENEIISFEKSKCEKDPAITIPIISFEFDPCSTSQLLNQNKSNTNLKCETNQIETHDLDNNLESRNNALNLFTGFRTASNKHIEISEKAFLKTKNMFDNIALNADVEEDNKYFNDVKKKNESLKTRCENSRSKCNQSSNKMLALSAFAMSRETVLQKSTTPHDFDFQTFHSGKIESLMGFQTANKMPIKVSSQALANSKKLFKDIENEENKLSPKNLNKCKSYNGFQTANNKPIKISMQALTKSKELFKDLDNDIDCMQSRHFSNSTSGTDQLVNRENFEDLINASGKMINATEETTDQNKLLLNNERTNKESVLQPKCFKFQGFQTANKKPIKISAHALANSKKLFKDIENEENYPNAFESKLSANKDFYSLSSKNCNNCKSYNGFQTANNKPIQISMQALTKSKELFKDIDNVIDCMQSKSFHSSNSTTGTADHLANRENFEDITNASGKMINATEESTDQNKLLLNNERTIKESVVQPLSFKFQGFQTASNKTVDVSEEVLAASKKIFEDIDNLDRVITPQSDYSTPFAGFKTASKKIINVSEIALQKSKHLFKDIDKNETNKTDDKLCSSISKDNYDEVHHTPFALEKRINQHLSTFQGIDENSLTKLIDTQVITNFEQTLHTEDFCAITPNKSKRSGSPILSCPRAKKRKKFQTPYVYKNVIDDKLTTNEKVNVNHKECTKLFNKHHKKTKTYSLLDLVQEEKRYSKTPMLDTNIICDTNITPISYDTLLELKFSGEKNDLTDSPMSVEDIKNVFLKAVNKKLVPEGWLDIHLKLIIWKLISYENIFPNTLKGVCSVRNVLDQLKYRYNKELYNAERPILRKILEKDDMPSKTLILCVVTIFENGQSVSSVVDATSNIELLLSDGWYTIKASIDRMLVKLVYDEKIKIGCKIATNGAELINCEQGVSPWEDISAVRLKIFGNSTRRARWYARLGCHGNGAMLTPLSSIRPEGGKVSKLRVFVTRVYPALFVEKFEDGSTVTRSERLEHIHQAKNEMERQTALEKLYEEVEKELSDQESQDSESSFANKRVFDSLSQRNVDSRLTHSQIRHLEVRSNKRRERMIHNIEKKMQEKMGKYGLDAQRNVITLLKLRVADVEVKNDAVVVTKGLLSIWKPADAIMEMIKEGNWIEVLNVFPTAVRYSEIQISAGRSSVFVESRRKESDIVKTAVRCLKRKCYHLKDLVENPTAPTYYNEIDTVGLIIQIEPQNAEFESSKQAFQNVYLADAEKNIICINFWGGLKKFGYRNILDTGQVVSCVNLQKRSGNTKKSIPHYRVTEFSYFTKTPKCITARKFVEELVKQLSGLDKRKFCDECVVIKNNFGRKHNLNNENYSPYTFLDHNITRNKMFIDSPQNQKIIDDNLNLTGLDFESAFKQDTQMSPQMLLRKKKVNEKIAKLKCYGEPPPLSPINIINISKNASNSFKSPLASKAESNVANKKESDKDCKKESGYIPSSPIMCINRTYVKSVNPVKLNFSNVHETSDNVIDDNIDHFAEEFDASPPLSFD